MLMSRSRKASSTKPTKNLLSLQFTEEIFPPFFNLLITRVTRKGTNHGSTNSLVRTIPKLVSQPTSEDMLSGIWHKEGKGGGGDAEEIASPRHSPGTGSSCVSVSQHKQILSMKTEQGLHSKI